jgi:hypothetical protein
MLCPHAAGVNRTHRLKTWVTEAEVGNSKVTVTNSQREGSVTRASLHEYAAVHRLRYQQATRPCVSDRATTRAPSPILELANPRDRIEHLALPPPPAPDRAGERKTGLLKIFQYRRASLWALRTSTIVPDATRSSHGEKSDSSAESGDHQLLERVVVHFGPCLVPGQGSGHRSAERDAVGVVAAVEGATIRQRRLRAERVSAAASEQPRPSRKNGRKTTRVRASRLIAA